MIKIKRRLMVSLRRFRSFSLKKRLLFVLAVWLGATLIYLSFSLLGLGRGTRALLSLQRSLEKNPACHEDCLLARSAWEQLIATRLVSSPGLNRRLARSFSNPRLASDFKKELVKISALAYGPNNPPDYLIRYLSASDGEPSVQTMIITLFSSPGLVSAPLMADWQKQVNDRQASASKRLAALRTLMATKDDSLLAFYFSCLAEDDDATLRQEAVRGIGNIRDKSSYFSSDQLALIKKLLLDSQTPNRLRADLVFLAGDYYPFFPAETLRVLTDLYQETPNDDQVSRALAADLVNRLGRGKKLALPDVSEADWDAYYNY